eukprot:scaffold6160_cov23-Cyclotella_meneghiniana.AAC.3
MSTTTNSKIIPSSFVVPTFKPQDEDPPKKLNVRTLSESQISYLKHHDPFMYHSIFSPDGQMLSGVKIRVEESKEEEVMVKRSTCVSAETGDVLAGELNEASAAYYVITDNESEED